MIDQTERTIPVAVWVQSIEDAQQPIFYNGFMCHKSADVRASSPDRKFTMKISTNALSRELLDKFEWFSQYGFTVIEVPDYWVDECRRPCGWCDRLINSALNRAALDQDQNERAVPSSSDFQQLSLLAEAKERAEKREGSKLMETIAKMGQSALPVLAKAGAEGLVHLIEHKLGAKL